MYTLKFIFTLIFIHFFSIGFTQISQLPVSSPPPESMPNKKQAVLIDSIIEIAGYKENFISYCTLKVKEGAYQNKWDSSKTNKILRSIDFKYYKTTIYNNYSFYSENELKKIIEALSILNKKFDRGEKSLITNEMLQNNLYLIAEGIVEGKYIME